MKKVDILRQSIGRKCYLDHEPSGTYLEGTLLFGQLLPSGEFRNATPPRNSQKSRRDIGYFLKMIDDDAPIRILKRDISSITRPSSFARRVQINILLHPQTERNAKYGVDEQSQNLYTYLQEVQKGSEAA